VSLNEIQIPGSVANLGGGFDTLGVAVQLYLRLKVVDVRDDGAARLTVVKSTPSVRGRNAVERAYEAMARRTGRRAPSVLVEVTSDIPLAAGLGSSAAATVAGLRAFEQVAGPIDQGELLAEATGLEGHADNAAPAIFGGLTSVLEQDGHAPVALRWNWPEELRLVVATPEAGLSTAKARAALADSIPRKDAVFNLQRVLSLVHALQNGDYDRLREGVQDRWHQPARAALIPHLAAALSLEDPDILGTFLSGAGPSVAVLVRRDFARVEQVLAAACARAGSPVTVRTLAVHHQTIEERRQGVPGDGVPGRELASVHGRTAV
jgi:homoserine kinase